MSDASTTLPNEVQSPFSLDEWKAAWPGAIAAWSRHARLREPIWCRYRADAKREGLDGGIAMIRLDDHRVVVSIPEIEERGLAGHALAILAHEAGHHVYAPGDLSDHGRMVVRARRALPRFERFVPLVLNLWTDLLVNDRLYRDRGIRIDEVYRTLAVDSSGELWRFYMKTYEKLWVLSPDSLALPGQLVPSSAPAGPAEATVDPEADMDADASLAARLVRSYSREFVRGSGRFAAVAFPYLARDYEQEKGLAAFLDALDPGSGAEPPDGLAEMDPDEEADSRHPARDGESAFKPAAGWKGRGQGQSRDPFTYGEVLRAMGIRISQEDAAIRYYRECALPHLVPFPERSSPRSREPLPEGWDLWEPGEPLDRIDWIRTLTRNPVVVPGLTVLQRVEGFQPGPEPSREPLWLDLYVDSSGSMPNPATELSYLTLAGAIVALSALRAGARVQATLWSGKDEVMKTDGFVADDRSILAALIGYFGGGTRFPLHVLRDSYARRGPADRPVHVFCISDDGITTMLDDDERGTPGARIAAKALKAARGGGTLALNLHGDWKKDRGLLKLSELGFDIVAVKDWESLVAFAAAFARKRYGTEAAR
ncbi:MAG: VWA domain-containing protein [Spirochaetes bacterium]|nr:VWA domain-containing protein [Spirochaetota bacterium]